jgi:hypothetical protein
MANVTFKQATVLDVLAVFVSKMLEAQNWPR